jgi:thiol-disulfide isomerase/thioredoxin
MAATPSVMIPLGTKAPDFMLLDPVTNVHRSFDELKSEVATVVMFICNHCPYVKHINEGLIALANDYLPKGVHFIAINSNDAVAYPQDGPEHMAEQSRKLGYPFPYLFDETQETARAYQAACTPDFYIFDGTSACVYRGQFDNSRPGNTEQVTGRDIRAALDALLEGRPVSEHQTPSIGCNIKWKQ